MTDVAELHREVVTRVLGDKAATPIKLRRNAFDNAGLDDPVRSLLGKVALRANSVTDADVAAARSAGLSEDQIFELVVCAAVGQASRQYESARAALDEATGTQR